MARVIGALLSVRATGTLANVLTYQQRGRKSVVYKFTIPHDVGNAAQQGVRNEVRDLARRWNAAQEEMREWLELFGNCERMSGFALWTREGWHQHCAGMPD